MSNFNPQQHMTKLQGKDYLEVKWRIVWFRDKHPQGFIETEPIVLSESAAIVKATVRSADGQPLATGMATVRSANSNRMSWAGRDFEKAETAAIGRALAHAGFGTQFTDEDEGDYLADSPVEQRQQPQTIDLAQWAEQVKAIVHPMYTDANGNVNPFHMKGSLNKLSEEGVIDASMSPLKAAIYILMHRAKTDYNMDTESVQLAIGGKVSAIVGDADGVAHVWSIIRDVATQQKVSA